MTMVDHLQGKQVERRIDTGVWMITKDNLDTAQSQELLKPPIDRFPSGSLRARHSEPTSREVL